MKKITSTLFALLIVVSAFADSRSVNEAQTEAIKFMSTASPIRRAPAYNSVQLKYTLQKPNRQEAAAYLFQIGQDNGFVLVSADDHASTILGYASQGTFNADSIPENMQTWFDHYAEEIAWAAEQQKSPFSKLQKVATHKAFAAPKASSAPISPLLGNIVWNQDAPFWNQCPLDSDGKRSYSGCVATATTQIMRFWSHPVSGIGSHSYTWTKSNGTKTTLSANFNTTYSWDNMLGNYNNSYTTTQADAVAKLMYHMGVATDMQYSSNGSGTQTELAAQALYKYFGYDTSMEAVRPDFCGFDYFAERMLDELQAGRPVLMSGSTVNNEGHAFVCDGYDGQFFHINWGWGGMQNSYFALSALDPDEQGMGGAASGAGFHVGILGVMGIKPNAGSTATQTSSLGTYGITNTAGSTITTTRSFTIKMNQIHNCGIIGFEGGAVGFGVYNSNDELVTYHSLYNFNELPVGYYSSNEIEFQGNLSRVTSDGEYKIVPIYKTSNDNNYKKMLVGYNSIQEIPFRKQGSTIYFSTPTTVSYPVTNLTASAAGHSINFSFDCDAPYFHVKVYNNSQTLADDYIDFNNASLSNVPAGTWTVWVCGADENRNDSGTPATVTVEVEDIDYNVYNPQATSDGSTVYIRYESEAPNFHVKIYNDEENIFSIITSYKNLTISDVQDGEWTVWIRPVDEPKKYYVGDAVTTTVTVCTRLAGDMDGDGRLSIRDLTLIVQLANNIKDGAPLTDEQNELKTYIDLNKNGVIEDSEINTAIEKLFNNLLNEE